MVCVSVKQGYQADRLKLDLINMNSGSSWFHSDELEDMDGAGKICLSGGNTNLLLELSNFYPLLQLL